MCTLGKKSLQLHNYSVNMDISVYAVESITASNKQKPRDESTISFNVIGLSTRKIATSASFNQFN